MCSRTVGNLHAFFFALKLTGGMPQALKRVLPMIEHQKGGAVCPVGV